MKKTWIGDIELGDFYTEPAGPDHTIHGPACRWYDPECRWCKRAADELEEMIHVTTWVCACGAYCIERGSGDPCHGPISVRRDRERGAIVHLCQKHLFLKEHGEKAGMAYEWK